MGISKGRAGKFVALAVGTVFVLMMGAVFLPGISHAQTQTAFNMKVQPALFEQVVNPGDRFSTSITVTNPGTVPGQFTVGVQDISGMKGEGEPVFTTSSVPEYGVSSWVSLDSTAITVPAGRHSRCAQMRVRLPSGAGLVFAAGVPLCVAVCCDVSSGIGSRFTIRIHYSLRTNLSAAVRRACIWFSLRASV